MLVLHKKPLIKIFTKVTGPAVFVIFWNIENGPVLRRFHHQNYLILPQRKRLTHLRCDHH